MAIKYTSNEERANYISHLFGLLMVLSASVYITLDVAEEHVSILFFISMLLYALGAGSSYLASAVYHHCPSKSIYREKFRKFDHAAIYWHIAGSYSPITLSAMSGMAGWGYVLFCTVWLCALAGTLMSFRKLKEHSNLETVCFIGMGLLMILAFDKVLYCIGWQSMVWIIAEGVAFITGAVFYSFNKVKYMHTVFHVFVLLGSFCHIMGLYYMFH